jgi:hypothetical protein
MKSPLGDLTKDKSSLDRENSGQKNWGCRMQLSMEERTLFYRLFPALLNYVNGKLAIIPEQFSDVRGFLSLAAERRAKVRDALYAQRELIDSFVNENPGGFSSQELEIVTSWKRALVGTYYVFRFLKQHTIFLSASEQPVRAYGVLGLIDPIENLFRGQRLPVLCQTVLLPFNGQIVYDGIIAPYSMSFGSGIRKGLNDSYNRAKETFGIITSLDSPPAAQPARPSKSGKKRGQTPATPRSRSAAGEAKAIAAELTKLTDAFCAEFLNEEYADLCRKLAATLARKRPSPLLQGNLNTWACGIVRTIGWVNFLDDRSQRPHLKMSVIDQTFGVAESTGQGKSRTIRNLLKIGSLDPRWTLRSRLDENPMVWMLQVNGFFLDIRDAPRALQEQAFAKGLIPYIPADRAEAGEDD